jgi:hypothetical protein
MTLKDKVLHSDFQTNVTSGAEASRPSGSIRRKSTRGLLLRSGIWHIDKVLFGKRICESTHTTILLRRRCCWRIGSARREGRIFTASRGSTFVRLGLNSWRRINTNAALSAMCGQRSSSAGLFAHPCARPAAANQGRDFDSPRGLPSVATPVANGDVTGVDKCVGAVSADADGSSLPDPLQKAASELAEAAGLIHRSGGGRYGRIDARFAIGGCGAAPGEIRSRWFGRGEQGRGVGQWRFDTRLDGEALFTPADAYCATLSESSDY